jgi:hypothetical protein
MNRRNFVLAALAVSGCATRPVVVSPGAEVLEELEALYGVRVGRRGVTFGVSSGGCTTKADFVFYVERRPGAVALAFGRKQVDGCKLVVRGRTDLSFTWVELGVAPNRSVVLLNPRIGPSRSYD